MTRFFRLPSFVAITAALTTFITAGPADARTPVRSVKAAVTVLNAAPGLELERPLGSRHELGERERRRGERAARHDRGEAEADAR